MKNRPAPRTLHIGEKEYLWSYNFDKSDYKNYPYSYYMFSPKDNQKLKVRVYFTQYENPTDITPSGTPCIYKGENVILNLCEPSAAKRVAEYVFTELIPDNQTGEVELRDGDEILRNIGYKDFEKRGG